MFNVERGTYYSEGAIRGGLIKGREAYGRVGYVEFTGYPEYKLRNRPGLTVPDAPETLKADALALSAATPIVDITMRLAEGPQFSIDRLTVTGSTRAGVIRREVRLVDGGVFNAEALKSGIKRLNQLGYFKPITTKDVDVQRTPGQGNNVDVNLRVEDR